MYAKNIGKFVPKIRNKLVELQMRFWQYFKGL